MKKVFALLCWGACLFLTATTFAAQPLNLKIINVGIIHDGAWRRLFDFDTLVKKEIQELVRDEWEVRFPKQFEVDGKWSKTVIKQGIDRLLKEESVHIILALGMVASDMIARHPNLTKPVIAPLILDHQAQNIPFLDGTSGVKNLSYIESSKSFARSLEVFYQVVPFRHVAVLTDPLISEVILPLKGFAKTIEQQRGFQISFIPVQAMPNTVDAVLLAPLVTLSETEIKQLITRLNERKLPSFSILGREEVEQGVMMSIFPSADYYRFARRIALILQKILLGETAGEQEVLLREGEELVINMATAQKVGARPTWEILAEADLIQDEPPTHTKKLTLSEAIEKAMQQNYDVLIASQDIRISQQDKHKALASLLPRLEAEYDYKQVDQKQAEQSLGFMVEREQIGHLTITQSLFSEPTWSNWSIQARLQTEKELALHNSKLDVGLETARAYLQSLKAKTFERVRKSDLKLTRSNLERAKTRQLVGVANASEVYRWETQIASKKKDYLTAEADTNQALVTLNKMLSFDQAEPLELAETDLTDSRLLISDQRLDRYLNNPWSVTVFNEFVVEQGLKNSIELQRLKTLIAAGKRKLDSAWRAHYLPTVALQAKKDRVFSQGGVGSDVEGEKNTWSLGITATLPLVTGGAQIAEVKKAHAELTRLELEFERTKITVEQRIRNALHKITASYAGINLANQSLEAAQKTLNFVTDSYARGVVPIIDVIDAQNSAFASEQTAANTGYAFLLDLMEVQRAVGRFDFFLTQDERDAFFRDLEQYFKTH